MTAQIQKSVQDAIEATQASQPSTEQLATQIQQSVQGAVQAIQASQPSTEQLAAQIQRSVEAAVATAPQGITAADVQKAVEQSVRQATAGQLTAAQVQSIVDRSISSLPAPEIDVGQIQGLIESAVRANVPEGTSAEEIQQLVSAAVTAATANAATRGDIESLVSESIMAAAADQLTADVVEKIVNASLSATNKAVEEAAMQAKAAVQAAQKAGEEAAMARDEAAAASMAGSVPAGCFVVGDRVTDCPVRSPHVWTAPPLRVGEFSSYIYNGPLPTQFYESPMSYQLVKQGKLPPLEERLPVSEDVLIIQPPEGIGEYGGAYRMTDRSTWVGEWALAQFAKRDATGVVFQPYAGKSFEVSDDGTTWTMKLRRGMKWSDGTPFTIEDIRFTWEDWNQYEEFTPTTLQTYRDQVTGNLVRFNVVDDETWQLIYDTPNYTLFEGKLMRGHRCTGKGNYCWSIASHHFKQFHPKYAKADDLKKLMDEVNAEHWTQLWGRRENWMNNSDVPTHKPWTLEESTGQHRLLTRNNFFYVVDPEGNQLPYMDKAIKLRVESRDVAVFRAMAGENDGQTAPFQTREVPLYITNMEKGDYSIYQWPSAGGNDAPVIFNQTWNEDPEIGKWVRTRDFRIALSHATNRVDINDTVFLQLGAIQNWVPHPSSPFHPGEDVAKLNVEYDPAKANQMLDALGLISKDADGFRLRTDGSGQPLELVLLANPDESADALELIKDHWAQVGIKAAINPAGTGDIRQNKSYMGMVIDFSAYSINPWASAGTRLAPTHGTMSVAPLIGQYYETQGQEGMAPTGPDPAYMPLAPDGTYPADASGNLKNLQDMWREGVKYNTVHPRRVELGKNIFRTNAEEMYVSPTVAFTGSRRGIFLNRNNAKNQPRNHIRDHFGFYSEAYYFEDGMDNLHHPGNRSKRYKSWSFLGGEY